MSPSLWQLTFYQLADVQAVVIGGGYMGLECSAALALNGIPTSQVIVQLFKRAEMVWGWKQLRTEASFSTMRFMPLAHCMKERLPGVVHLLG